jgi:hypothetical protein
MSKHLLALPLKEVGAEMENGEGCQYQHLTVEQTGHLSIVLHGVPMWVMVEGLPSSLIAAQSTSFEWTAGWTSLPPFAPTRLFLSGPDPPPRH